MKVENIHERRLCAGTFQCHALIDGLASRAELLWPVRQWPPLRLDRPLGVGAQGGHGPVRYFVERYRPGEEVWFRFTRPRGFDGGHGFQVLAAGDGAMLRHSLRMEAVGPARLTWPLIFRPLHDALIEDALARAQESLGESPEYRAWSVRVRVLRWLMTRR